MDIQRIRNLTTGRLHTSMEHIYQDIEFIIGEKGITTHQLPKACNAMQPYLKSILSESRLWEDVYDPTHTGSIDVMPMDVAEREAFWKLYAQQ